MHICVKLIECSIESYKYIGMRCMQRISSPLCLYIYSVVFVYLLFEHVALLLNTQFSVFLICQFAF